MASFKRSVNRINSEGSSEQAPRKRVRVSEVLADHSSADSDSDDVSGPPIEAVTHDEDGAEVDEEELQRGTQMLRDRYARLGDNVPAENGIIERVDCYNFMCHEHFSVELGPLINFIVGKNGSGKSAILTALTLCLGGKASVTNRGQSLKSFIKEGKDSATIVVRIKNRGDTAYLPHEFGDSIIVERHFTKNGTSGFRIKSASGRVVSTRKADLDSITDYFALQIDNPMNVLSQDMARQFLSNSTPAEKYKFFIKGVQLEQLDQDYKLLEETLEQIRGKIAFQMEELKVLEANRKRAQDRLALSDRQEGLRERIRNLRAQHAWAQVEEQERVLDACIEEVVRVDRKIADLEREVESIDRTFQNAEREQDAAQRAVQEAKAELEVHSEAKASVKERYEETLKERHELQAQQRSISEHLKAAEARIRDIKQKIKAETERLANLDGGSNARMTAELEQKQASAAEKKNLLKQKRRDRRRVEDEVTNAEKHLESLDAPIKRKHGELAQAQNRLRMLRQDRGQQQNGFPERMSLLLRAIENETRFSRRPVGPLGRHVRLLKQQWSSVLETTFGTTLNSFVVTSKRDLDILSDLMKKVDCRCPIFIGNDNGPFDTSPHEPDARFDTALRVLEIDNELVRRQLVINHGIEQILLIEDLEEASRILIDGERPRNVKRCLCIDKRDKRRGIHLAYNRMGDPNQSPVQAYNGHPRMNTDLESRIRMQQDIVNTLDKELQEMMQQRRDAQSNLERCRQTLRAHRHEEEELDVESQRADDLVDQLRDEIDRNSVNDGNLQALKAVLEESEDEKRLNEASYVDCVAAMDALTERLKAIKRELAAKDAEMAPLEDNIRRLEEEEVRLATRRKKALGDKNIALGRVEVAKREKREAEQKQQELEARVSDFREKASLVSPRVSIDRGETPASLDKKLDKLMRDQERYSQQLGATRDELAAAANEADEKYQRSLRQIKEFELTQSMLKSTLANRQDRWIKFRDYITARARLQFGYLLSERGFRGRILTDHKGKLLDLQVEPDITKDNSAGRGARTLSGGEKSFSQICLLLALWEAMGSPIRCLDEFDVYMDSLNRTMSIDMLMSAARRSVGRQFILITPGSRNDIRLAPDVRVNELAEPERGQRTLPFGR
ncbi:hypothetical protein VTO42DRAFT_4327 [Malbranchea cinnamomea]